MEILDLASLDTAAGAEAGFELQLRHPATRDPLPMWITVRGQDGATFRDVQRELERRRLETAQRRNQSVTHDDIEEDTIELLGRTTLGWRGNFTLDGQELPFSTLSAMAVYRRFVWIREQVAAAEASRANFLPGSPSA